MADKEDKTDIDIADPDVTEPGVGDEPAVVDEQPVSPKTEGRKVSVSLRTVVVAALVVGYIVSVGVPIWLYVGAKAKLDEETRQAANDSHAEHIALDYAVDAAKIESKDLGPWKTNLVKGTTPELKDKLDKAATSMEQILVPLQWNSTATPLVAKVRSNANGIYVVDSFVSVETKTVQAPDGVESTATYSITIDSNHDWQISEVGGVGAVVGHK